MQFRRGIGQSGGLQHHFAHRVVAVGQRLVADQAGAPQFAACGAQTGRWGDTTGHIEHLSSRSEQTQHSGLRNAYPARSAGPWLAPPPPTLSGVSHGGLAAMVGRSPHQPTVRAVTGRRWEPTMAPPGGFGQPPPSGADGVTVSLRACLLGLGMATATRALILNDTASLVQAVPASDDASIE